jgi:hypothetical protein
MTMMARSLNTQAANGFSPVAADLISAAGSCAEVATALGIDDGVDPAQASAFFAALPPSVDAALLAALKSAAERNIPFTLQWVPAAYFKATVYEGVDVDAGVVGALIECPWVRDLNPGIES